MQMTGRHQVSVPKAGSNTLAIGTANNSLVIFATGDAVLTAAVAANAGTGALNVAIDERCGFAAAQTVILGYGTKNEETLTVDATMSAATSSGNLVITGPIVRAHAKNERVIVKPTKALIPGTVTCTQGTVVDAPATGALSGTNLNSTASFVDYSTASVRLVYSVAPVTGAVNIVADAVTDNPDVNEITGNAFQKNWQSHNLNRQSIPEVLRVANLGTRKVGLFVEVSKNGGRSFTMKGLTTVTAQLGQYGTKMITVPGGQAGSLDVVRVRGGVFSSEAKGQDETDPQERHVRTGCIEIDTMASISDNGQ